PRALSARTYPQRVRGFAAIMRAELIRWRGRQEEPGVVTLGHGFRRDPARIRHEFVKREHHAAFGQHVEKRRLALGNRHTVAACEVAGLLCLDETPRTSR